MRAIAIYCSKVTKLLFTCHLSDHFLLVTFILLEDLRILRYLFYRDYMSWTKKFSTLSRGAKTICRSQI